MRAVEKREKKSKAPWIFAFAALVLACLLVGAVILYRNAYASASVTGETVGAVSGKAAGLFKGSFEGVTQDVYGQGYDSGKTDGLSAADTSVSDTVGEMIRGCGKLEVLVVSMSAEIAHKDSDKYNALYLLPASAVFTVDLSRAQVDTENLTVTLDEPAAPEFYYDESHMRLVAEDKAEFFDGKTKDGMDAYANSVEKGKEKMEEEILGDKDLQRQAEEAAVAQVEALARNMTGVGYKVEFRG